MAPPLQDLPTELQSSIIRLLDPISLISLSQASSHFRSLISPQKKHFAERLLELELLPKHGGPCPIFRARDNYISPSPLDPEWEDIRWACASCLRLLPHLHFDNHSILKLRYRKPDARTAGSPQAVTSWEPSGRRLSRHLKKGNDGLKHSDEKRVRLRYSICVSRGRGTARYGEPPMSSSLATLLSCGMTGLDGMTQEDLDALTSGQKLRIFDENARVIERERCGTMRHLRKCNECRYQHGDLRPQLKGRGRNLKASTMPILPSRRTSAFGTYLDRWFPGFSDAVENKRPDYNALVYWVYMRWLGPGLAGWHRTDTPREQRARISRERFLAVYTARCPGCARWQEVRNFRMHPRFPFPHWRPNTSYGHRRSETTPEEFAAAEASLDDSRCNACFAAEKGREALADALCSWFRLVSASELHSLSCALSGGGGVWALDPFSKWTHCCYGQTYGALGYKPREYVREIRAIVGHASVERFELNEDLGSVTYAGVATLRLRLAQWKDLWERTKRKGDVVDGGEGWAGRDMDEWYEDFLSDFDEAEEHWRWLMAARAEVEERPMALVEWALGETPEA